MGLLLDFSLCRSGSDYTEKLLWGKFGCCSLLDALVFLLDPMSSSFFIDPLTSGENLFQKFLGKPQNGASHTLVKFQRAWMPRKVFFLPFLLTGISAGYGTHDWKSFSHRVWWGCSFVPLPRSPLWSLLGDPLFLSDSGGVFSLFPVL